MTLIAPGKFAASFSVLIFSFAASLPDVLAYDEEAAKKVAEEMKTYNYTAVASKDGLNFMIPEDMPIQTKGGITAPVPFTDYLYYKLKKSEERIIAAEKRVSELETKQAALEKKVAELDGKLKIIGDQNGYNNAPPNHPPPPQREPQNS